MELSPHTSLASPTSVFYVKKITNVFFPLRLLSFRIFYHPWPNLDRSDAEGYRGIQCNSPRCPVDLWELSWLAEFFACLVYLLILVFII